MRGGGGGVCGVVDVVVVFCVRVCVHTCVCVCACACVRVHARAWCWLTDLAHACMHACSPAVCSHEPLGTQRSLAVLHHKHTT